MREFSNDSYDVDLSKYNSKFPLKVKIKRLAWIICCSLLFKPFFLNFFNRWRVLVLKAFGAKIGKGTVVYSSVKIWAPWLLEIGSFSCLGRDVDCYNQGKIIIGNHTVISQKVYLCASTHDYESPTFPLVTKQINIGNQVWIAADAFIGPNTVIGNGAVIGARSAVFSNVGDWMIFGGNPAKFIKQRTIK